MLNRGEPPINDMSLFDRSVTSDSWDCSVGTGELTGLCDGCFCQRERAVLLLEQMIHLPAVFHVQDVGRV